MQAGDKVNKLTSLITSSSCRHHLKLFLLIFDGFSPLLTFLSSELWNSGELLC